jgi:hypothetical protein
MRLPIIPPANLNSEQKPLYDDMREGIAGNFQGFINVRDDGALLGPWNPWIHEPQFGKPVWELTKAMVTKPSLPPAVREVAILVTSALVGGGVLPELTYRAAVEQFGAHGAAELSYLVGLYCLVSVTLNTFDVPVPES